MSTYSCIACGFNEDSEDAVASARISIHQSLPRGLRLVPFGKGFNQLVYIITDAYLAILDLDTFFRLFDLQSLLYNIRCY